MAEPIISKTFSQRLLRAALTLGLPIIALALLPVIVLGLRELASALSQSAQTDIEPGNLAVVAGAIIYTIYSLRDRSSGLKAGLGAILSSFLTLDLVPIVRGLSLVGERSATFLGAVALFSLIAIEFLGDRRGQHTKQKK